MIIKKILLLFLCLVIIIVGLIMYFYLVNLPINIVKASDVDKMTISNFVEEGAFATTDRILIEDIANQINNLSYSRHKFDYESGPDIAIHTFSKNGDMMCSFYLYGGFGNNEYYCRYEKNGKRSGYFLVDAEKLFNLAQSYLPPEKIYL